MVVAIVFDALLAGSAEAVASSGTDGGSLASVFLVGCHVADAGVEPDGVVVGPLEVEFSAEYVDVGDEFEVGLFSLEVPEQRFDPCLVGRGAGPACWRSAKVAFWDQRRSRSRVGHAPRWVRLAAARFGGVGGGGGEGLVLA